MQIVPTLNFGGTCREAIHMYEKAFHGKISCLITYGEANDPEYNLLLKDNQKEYIYHSELLLNNQRIIMSDHVDIEFQTCYSNFLTMYSGLSGVAIAKGSDVEKCRSGVG